MSAIAIDTPHGPASAQVEAVDGARGAFVLGHGAGGGIAAPDLTAAVGVARSLGMTTVLVEQPYRVAGKNAPPPAPRLDEAWLAVIEQLRAQVIGRLPLVTGGRSSGARVACRTAEATGAAGVLCLAFPLRPPRREGREPAASRLPELDAVQVPVLIVQGMNDPFGMPEAAVGRTVVEVAGDHGLKSDLAAVRAAIAAWLPALLAERIR